MTNLRQFFFSLNNDDREAFANIADTTVNYIQRHLVLPNPAKRKSPSKTTLKNLSKACDSFRQKGLTTPTYNELVNFFYGEETAA